MASTDSMRAERVILFASKSQTILFRYFLSFLFNSRSIKFNLGSRNRISVIDAGWHPKLDDDLIVCLTNLNNLIYFQVSNPNVALKEYIFSNLNLHSISATDLNTNSTIKSNSLILYYISSS